MHYTSIRQRPRRISPSLSLIFIVNFYFSCSPLLLYAAMDTITRDQSISHGKTVVSAGEKFELGFFNPNDQDFKNTQYLGIWYYNLVPKTVVWVANRDSPITNSTPIFTIGDNGNLMVLDANRNIYWSTGASLDSNSTSAKLMDSGNLILSEGNSSKIIWQSFDCPSDTFLSGMKLDKNRRLTSWKTEKDPSLGTFTFGIDKDGADEFIIWNKKAMYWKSRFSTGIDELGYTPGAVSDLLTKFSLTGKNSTYVNISISKPSEDERLLMLPSGQIKYFIWKKNVSKWDSPWWEPSNNCSVYHACGPNSKCNNNTTPVCNCLPGYDSSSPEDWNSSEFSGGCRRKMEGCKKDDTFLKLNIVKVADTNRSTIALVEYGKEEDCKTSCLNDCNCMAYMYKTQDTWRRGINLRPICWIWSEDLMDAQEEHHGGQDFWLRQPAVKSANQSLGVESGGKIPSEPPCNFSKDCQSWPHSTCKADKMRCICNENFLWNPSVGCVEGNSSSRRSSRRSLFGIVFPLTSITVIIFLGIIGYWWRKKSLKRKDAQRAKVILGVDKFRKNERKDLDIPFFDFQSIAVATNNFSDSNKLGQGGFGPVYKGNLPGGQEIAVKRLSRCSGQGLEEFKTEVILIAKLQHRNLVRLLGYCVQGDEQMLLYEYMPNKSLDYYLFDQNRHTLDWEKRLSIISGIARGLLYLHQDSRLRIIHRDLKPSNILLDELWNPKISDFGMARIFGENQTQANTNRVIGTYGYMPPEYALEGTYSEKSDVFSFGVMLLEIISGKKNTTFYHSEHSFSLLGNTWRLWREGRGLELMDPLLNEGSNIQDVLKYIHVGLLCVQQDAADRPTMASVVAMFVGESNNLATPNKPAFFTTKSLSAVESSSHGSEICSKNEITISTLQGR